MAPERDDVGKHLPRADRGQLVDIAHENQRGPLWNRLQQRVHQRDIDHRDLVDDEKIAVQRAILVAPEASMGRVGLQQTVQRPGLEAGRLAQALGGAACRSGQGGLYLLGAQDPEDRVEQGRLADARPAGDDKQLGSKSKAHGVTLARCQLDADLALDPGDGLLTVDRRPGRRAPPQLAQPFGDAALGTMQAGEENAVAVIDRVRDDLPLRNLQLQSLLDGLGGHLQELRRELAKLVGRQAAMPLVHRLRQGKADAGTNADHRRLRDPQPLRDLIGAPEADAADVAGQTVGVLADDLHGIGAVGLEDPDRSGGAHPMAVEKEHDLPDGLLIRPGPDDRLGPLRPDPLHLLKALRRLLDDVEHALPEDPERASRHRPARCPGSCPSRGSA